MAFVDKEATEDNPVESKIFDGDDFRFFNVTVERPLRLRSKFSQLKIDEMLYDKADVELSKWLYQTYGERLFTGIDDEITAIKSYLQEQEIKKTDKQLNSLTSAKKWQERGKRPSSRFQQTSTSISLPTKNYSVCPPKKWKRCPRKPGHGWKS